ncbi:hypothetical protein BURMUCGD1_1431 [Burkholderia multivorans CGD1]|nr:hypothetical protein BURMUCGD1_1431 [Burkholderia multivorans CGD1]
MMFARFSWVNGRYFAAKSCPRPVRRLAHRPDFRLRFT